MEELYKNPIIHGILASILTLGIMYVIHNCKKEKGKKKRKFKIDIIPIIIIGAVVWFVSGTYFNNLTQIFSNQLGGSNSQPITMNKQFTLGDHVEITNDATNIFAKTNMFDQLHEIPEIGAIKL